MCPIGQLSAVGNAEPARRSRSGQSRAMSAVEAVINVAVGLGVSMALTAYLAGVPLSTAAHWSVWFTVASLARSYALRRLFARWG